MPPAVSISCGLLLLAISLGLVAATHEAWEIWLTYGLCCGLSFGFTQINVISTAVIRLVPRELEGRAMAAVAAGAPLGQLLLLPAFTHVATSLGWRYGYALLSGCALAFACAACALPLCRGAPTDRRSAEAPSSACGTAPLAAPLAFHAQVCGILSSRPYQTLTFVWLCCGVTTVGVLDTHLVPIVVWRGFTVDDGVALIATSAATSVVGQLMAGFLVDRFSRTWLLCGLYITRALSYVTLIAFHSRAALYVAAVLFGLSSSVLLPIISLVRTHAGTESVGLGVSISCSVSTPFHATASHPNPDPLPSHPSPPAPSPRRPAPPDRTNTPPYPACVAGWHFTPLPRPRWGSRRLSGRYVLRCHRVELLVRPGCSVASLCGSGPCFAQHWSGATEARLGRGIKASGSKSRFRFEYDRHVAGRCAKSRICIREYSLHLCSGLQAMT